MLQVQVYDEERQEDQDELRDRAQAASGERSALRPTFVLADVLSS